MSIHKVIEVISQSDRSWEDAAQKAVADAARTVKSIKSIYIKEMQGVVNGDRGSVLIWIRRRAAA
jgi:flavin-binding protein dodecin